jgi:hypothetical protein
MRAVTAPRVSTTSPGTWPAFAVSRRVHGATTTSSSVTQLAVVLAREHGGDVTEHLDRPEARIHHRAHDRADLGHHERRPEPVPRHVAHRDQHRAVGPHQHVVVVAARRRGGDDRPREIEARDRGAAPRVEVALDPLGHRHLDVAFVHAARRLLRVAARGDVAEHDQRALDAAGGVRERPHLALDPRAVLRPR